MPGAGPPRLGRDERPTMASRLRRCIRCPARSLCMNICPVSPWVKPDGEFSRRDDDACPGAWLRACGVDRMHLRVPGRARRERGGGEVTSVVSGPMPGKMSQNDYLSGLNDIAIYAATRGSPLFLPRHIAFLTAYMSEWKTLQPGPHSEKDAMEVFFWGAPRWAERLSSLLARAGIHGKFRLAPFFIWLTVKLLWQFVWSSVNNAGDIVKKGIRSVPPLVTVVVVVFVTSDAWRILGTGFTLRFFMLVTALLLASLLYLIRQDWWEEDVAAAEDEVKDLVEGIKHWKRDRLDDFMARGAKAVPMKRPRGLSDAYGRLAYLALVAFSLIAVAIFVSVILIIVGLILVNKGETAKLAGSDDIYQSFSGIVITKQLLSLSLSLGAFAAFFLVAAQRGEDRDAFMKAILARYRRALLVYTIYCHAHDLAEEWTGVPVKLKLCKPDAPEPHPQEDSAVVDLAVPP